MNLLDSKLYIDDICEELKEYDFRELDGKTILVTGATGLICSSLVDLLIVLKKNGLKINIIAAGRNKDKIYNRFQGQVILLKYDAILPVDLPDSIDYIVHGAGSASPELYTSKPVETMLSNIEGVKNLLEYCAMHQTRMVYISSSEVYGKKDTEDAFTETDYGYIDQDNIRNSYSESKRASEMLCRSYAKEYGVQVCMMRPGHIYGPTASEKDKRISSDFAYKAAKGENLVMLSPGMQKRSYCYCLDCACAILMCLLKGCPGEAYNIGTKERTSIREMALFFARAGEVELSAKEPTEEEKNAFNPMNNSSLTDVKIRNLGFKQKFSAETGLDHTVKILKECFDLAQQ